MGGWPSLPVLRWVRAIVCEPSAIVEVPGVPEAVFRPRWNDFRGLAYRPVEVAHGGLDARQLQERRFELRAAPRDRRHSEDRVVHVPPNPRSDQSEIV